MTRKRKRSQVRTPRGMIDLCLQRKARRVLKGSHVNGKALCCWLLCMCVDAIIEPMIMTLYRTLLSNMHMKVELQTCHAGSLNLVN
jgi:hypothetical protein